MKNKPSNPEKESIVDTKDKRIKISFYDALKFPFKGKKWIKRFVIGGIFASLLPFLIPAFFLNGYLVRIAHLVSEGKAESLPEWNLAGDLFKDGFKLSLAFLLYVLPGYICIAYGFVAPELIVRLLCDISGNPDIIFPFAILIFFSTYFASNIPFVLVSFWLLAVKIIFVEKRTFKSCFYFRKAFQLIKDNFKEFLIVFLIAMGLQSLSIFGVLFLFVGFPFLLFYSLMVEAHLLGQILKIRKESDLT